MGLLYIKYGCYELFIVVESQIVIKIRAKDTFYYIKNRRITYECTIVR